MIKTVASIFVAVGIFFGSFYGGYKVGVANEPQPIKAEITKSVCMTTKLFDEKFSKGKYVGIYGHIDDKTNVISLVIISDLFILVVEQKANVDQVCIVNYLPEYEKLEFKDGAK